MLTCRGLILRMRLTPNNLATKRLTNRRPPAAGLQWKRYFYSAKPKLRSAACDYLSDPTVTAVYVATKLLTLSPPY